MEFVRDKKKLYGLIFTGVLFIGLVCCIWLLGQKGPSQSGGLSYLPDADAADWSSGVSQTSGIKIPGYGEIYFPSQTQDVSMTLYNPKENSCNFVFSLYINDAESPIYTSGAVAPGKAVTDFTLNQPLEEGSYALHIRIDTYDQTSGLPLNNAVLTTKLTVGE